jgi:hypothetical protein
LALLLALLLALVPVLLPVRELVPMSALELLPALAPRFAPLPAGQRRPPSEVSVRSV